MKFRSFMLSALIVMNLALWHVSTAQLEGGSPSISALASSSIGTVGAEEKQKVVIVTGARFTYPLVQKWIDEYYKVNSEVQIVIEARGSSDPKAFDILAEVFEHDAAVKKNREYAYVGRYAVLPVANSQSAFAKTYGSKGINLGLMKQLYFYDEFADDEEEIKVTQPYTVYTRLQKAGAPIVFSKYFGFEQKDIKGKAIAGADEHLLKALLRDTTGLSYLPLPLVYNTVSGKPVDGLAVLPVDFNGNGRVSDDEKFYGDLASVVSRLEGEKQQDISNLPLEYIHLSVDRKTASAEALDFLQWVGANGQQYLHQFGYLKPEGDTYSNFAPESNEAAKGRK